MLTEQQVLEFGFVPVAEHHQIYPGMKLYRYQTGTYIGRGTDGKFYYVEDGICPISLDAVELQMYKQVLTVLVNRANSVDEIKHICEVICTGKHQKELQSWMEETDAVKPSPYKLPYPIPELIITNL